VLLYETYLNSNTDIRELVVLSYKPPQVASLESMVPVVAQFQSDFRRVYMEHPRVRLDGVYIAVCHYVYAVSFLESPNFDSSYRRPGLSENSWVNVCTVLVKFPRIDLTAAGGGHS
jgi:F-box protein 9